MEQLLHSMVYVLRGWRRRPAFWFAAAGTLALGIGTTAAVFSVLDAAVLRPLPLPDSDRLVKVVQVARETGDRYGVSFHSFYRWQERSSSFAHLAAHRQTARLLRQGEEAHRVLAAEVSEGYFPSLGLPPVLGRTLVSRDASQPGGEAQEAVLSHGFWRSRLNGDQDVLGRVLVLDGEPYEVVGVMPRAGSLPLLGEADLWIPLRIDVAGALQTPVWGFGVIGRLAPGVSEEAAQKDLDAVTMALATERPELHGGWGAEVKTLRWWLGGEIWPALLAVFAAAFSIFVVAGANVASLALERLMARRGEIETRLALGATRWRLWRLFLAEGVFLAIVGGVGGIVLAWAGVRWVHVLAPENLPRLEEVGLDLRALAFLVALAAVSGLLALCLPAAFYLRWGRTTGSGGRANERGKGERGQALLVVGQVALALLVGFAAALVAQSQENLRRVPAGFEPRGLMIAGVQLPTEDGRRGPEREAALRRLLARAADLPGVEAVALSVEPLPLDDGQGVFSFYPPGTPEEPGKEAKALAATVSAGYFRALSIPLLRGRLFLPEESWEQTPVVVINAALARRYWPNRDPVGQEIHFGDRSGRRGRIIGVVGDARQVALHIPPAGQIFVPWGGAPPVQRLILRGGDLTSLLPVLRQSAWREAGGVLFDIRSGDEILMTALARHRFFALLFRVAALFVGVLGVVGIYGVVASGVGRRTREIGIRMALGSSPWMILRRTVMLGLAPVVLGLALGLGGTAFVSRGLGELLFETRPLELGALLGVIAMLILAALVACVVPARRAARANPVEALRVGSH